MFPNKDIVDNAVNSADNTTLVAAVKAAGLVSALKGSGPLTVFAPTNAAFDALPPGTVTTLLQPQNKGTLTAVLTYHVVPGRLDFTALSALIAQGGGKAVLKTLNGATLTASMNGPRNIVLTDNKGRRRPHHDLRRVSVERRDPGHRQGPNARLRNYWPRALLSGDDPHNSRPRPPCSCLVRCRDGTGRHDRARRERQPGHRNEGDG